MKLDADTLEPIWVKSITASSTFGAPGIQGLAVGPNDDLYLIGATSSAST